MAARVLPEDVRYIIETDLDDTSLDVFILSANLIINNTMLDKSIPEDVLKEIERWLSAHFVAMRERQETAVTVGDGSARYGGRFGYGLDFTQYGQAVKIIDYTHTLEDVGKRSYDMEILEFAV